MAARILTVDDDDLILKLVRRSLETAGYEVITAVDGQAGWREFGQSQPDLVVLDVMMPQVNGWELCERIRQVSEVPIIILTALGSTGEVVKGLQLGADDYLVKPFYPEELQARVEAILRRIRMQPPDNDSNFLCFGNGELIINPSNRQVMVHSKLVDLTPTEYELLLFMAQQPGRVLTIQSIFNEVWPYGTEADQDNVKWYVWRLRQKIEDNPHRPLYILTEHGIGYRFTWP